MPKPRFDRGELDGIIKYSDANRCVTGHASDAVCPECIADTIAAALSLALAVVDAVSKPIFWDGRFVCSGCWHLPGEHTSTCPVKAAIDAGLGEKE